MAQSRIYNSIQLLVTSKNKNIVLEMVSFDLDEVFFCHRKGDFMIHRGCEVGRKLFQVAYSIYMQMRVT